MVKICPTVTANDAHEFRAQVERVSGFAKRLHFDFMDGLFTKNQSIPLEMAWMPEDIQIDFHMMYMRPDLFIKQILRFKPSLVIVQAEAKGDFGVLADQLHGHDIKVGVALLQDTSVSSIAPAVNEIDHVLIFSGHLGYFGGKADLGLLDKVQELRALKPDLEIAWDGGINDENAKILAEGGIDVLDVGGFIQHADNPAAAYAKLEEVTGNK